MDLTHHTRRDIERDTETLFDDLEISLGIVPSLLAHLRELRAMWKATVPELMKRIGAEQARSNVLNDQLSLVVDTLTEVKVPDSDLAHAIDVAKRARATIDRLRKEVEDAHTDRDQCTREIKKALLDLETERERSRMAQAKAVLYRVTDILAGRVNADSSRVETIANEVRAELEQLRAVPGVFGVSEINIQRAIADAVVAYGGVDGTFNSANFSHKLCDILGIPGPLDGKVVDQILCYRHDIRPLRGGAHWQYVNPTNIPTHNPLSSLQKSLPWGLNSYNEAFLDDTSLHRDFAHALLHVQKAAGKLAGFVDISCHVGSIPFDLHAPKIAPLLADLVQCALRMANTVGPKPIDLGAELLKRIGDKAKHYGDYVTVTDGQGRAVTLTKKDGP